MIFRNAGGSSLPFFSANSVTSVLKAAFHFNRGHDDKHAFITNVNH
jgi:hypothetical protein